MFNNGMLLQGGAGKVVLDTLLGVALVCVAAVAAQGSIGRPRLPVPVRIAFTVLAAGILWPNSISQTISALLGVGLYAFFARRERRLNFAGASP